MANKKPTEEQASKEVEVAIKLNKTQIEALTCKATEVMYGGAKGGGKSFLARYAAFILATAVPHLQIYIIRRTYAEVRGNFLFGKDGLLNLVQPLVDNGDATVNLSDNRVDFCNGAQIYLRHMQNPDKDIETIRGRDIHVAFLDESTQWLTRDVYNQFRTCLRCALEIDYDALHEEYPFISNGYFPRVYMLTNPGGRGHLFHKEMFLDGIPPNTDVQMPPEEGGMLRRFIPAFLEDNTALMRLDPNYKNKLLGSGRHVEKMLKGDWDVPEGSCLAIEWKPKYNIIEPFQLPEGATIDRTYDFGTSKPWACIYTYESHDEEITFRDGTKRTYPWGTLFVIGELYGWNGRADEGDHKTAREQGKAIKEYEMNAYWGRQVQVGPADGAIFSQQGMDTNLNDEIVAGYNSVSSEGDNFWNVPVMDLFDPADKSKGSRVKGLALIQAYLKGAHDTEEGYWSEESGLIFFSTCKQCLRTLPAVPYDPLDMTVNDTKSEDHLFDCVKYRVFTNRPKYQKLDFVGFNS